MSGITTCKTCHDPIRWANTAENNRRIPLNADPVIGGNIRLVGRTAHVLSADSQRFYSTAQQPQYVSHFVTCPQSNVWRSR